MPDAVPVLKVTGPTSPTASDFSAEHVSRHSVIRFRGRVQRRCRATAAVLSVRGGLIMRELILLGYPFVFLMLLWVYIVHHPNELSAFLLWVQDSF
jgi:hypothetical protein